MKTVIINYLCGDMVNALSSTNREKLGYDSEFSRPSTVKEDTICQYTNSTGSCSSGESKSSTLISDKVDTSNKDINSDYVLKRLGQAIDTNTSSKVKPKERVSKILKKLGLINQAVIKIVIQTAIASHPVVQAPHHQVAIIR